MDLGTWQLDDYLPIPVNAHSPAASGAATDPDGNSALYRIYESGDETPIATGTATLFDPANTAGFCLARVELAAGDGFEVDKDYEIYISAAVGGTPGTLNHIFRIRSGREDYAKLGEHYPVLISTHDPTDSSQAADPDAAPTYRIYKQAGATPVATGTLDKLDDANTLGLCIARVELAAATFESADYTVYVQAIVGGITVSTSRVFKIKTDYSAPSTPTLALADDETGSSFTATLAGDDDATHYLLYKATTATTWTSGGSRSGDGTIQVSGLSDDTGYHAFSYALRDGLYSSPSGVEYVKVTDGTGSVTASGLATLPLHYLRQTLAASATFQAWVSTETAAEALEHIYPVTVTSITPPFAFVDWEPNFARTFAAGGTRSHFRQRGDLALVFRGPISTSHSDADAAYEFLNKLGAILSEMEQLAGTAGYLDIATIRADGTPTRPHEDEKKSNTSSGSVVGDYYQQVYIVERAEGL